MMIEFKIPDFSNIDWQQEIAEADEMDKLLLPCLARAANLLDGINEEANPQSIAWMIIWTQVFLIIQNALVAVRGGAEFTLRILDRSIFELHLIMFAIIPESISGSLNEKEELHEKLAAYAAWCIYNDIKAYDRKLERRNIDSVWDESFKYEIAKDPDHLVRFEKRFGKIEFENPDEVSKMKRDYEQKLWENQNQLSEISQHPEILPWINKLEKASEKPKTRIFSFFELIGGSRSSIRKELEEKDLKYTYSIYEEASLLLHGSTFNNLFHVHDNTAYPRINVPPDIISNLAQSIGSSCNSILVLLTAIKKYL